MQPLRRSFGVLLLSISIGSFAATPATALSMTPNPLDLTYFGEELVARVTFVGSVLGAPTDGITLRGAVAPTDVSLLFTVEYIAQSIAPLAQLQMIRSSGAWSAVGWIPGSNVDWSGSFQLVGTTAHIYSFDLDTAGTSDVFFVSTPSIADGTGLDFSFQGYHGVPYGLATATVVPEPTTLPLVAAGLAIVATRRRRP